MTKLFTLQQLAKIKGVGYEYVRKLLMNAKDKSQLFGFKLLKVGTTWLAFRPDNLIEPASDEDVAEEIAKRKGLE